MATKTVEIGRKIRDVNYKATKKLSVEDQIKLINKKADQFRKAYKQNDKETA